MYQNAAICAAVVLYSAVAGRVGRFWLKRSDAVRRVASLILGPAMFGVLLLAVVPLAALSGTAAEPLGSRFITCFTGRPLFGYLWQNDSKRDRPECEQKKRAAVDDAA